MIFKFRMLSDENDFFVRDYEVMYDTTLLDFHKFICRDLGFDPDNMASFFLSDPQWSKGREFTLFDMGHDQYDFDEDQEPLTMDDAILGQIIHRNHDRLIWLFDHLGDRACYLELTATSEQKRDTDYPRTVKSEGEAPNQFDPSFGSANMSIFDQAMDEFNDFEEGEEYDDEL